MSNYIFSTTCFKGNLCSRRGTGEAEERKDDEAGDIRLPTPSARCREFFFGENTRKLKREGLWENESLVMKLRARHFIVGHVE